jgi:hypothetical protein
MNGQKILGIQVSNELEAEEEVLRNTFVNSQAMQQPTGMNSLDMGRGLKEALLSSKLGWVDLASKQKTPLAKEGP